MVQKPEGRNHQRNRVEGNQCFGRIDECEDPEDQFAGLRLSQSSTLPQRDHVSPGGLDTYPKKSLTNTNP